MRSIPLVVAIAVLMAGCASNSTDDIPSGDTVVPTPTHPATITDESPTERSLWRNLTGEFAPGECREVVVASKGLHKKAQTWLVVRKGIVEVKADQVDDGYVEKITCTYENHIPALTMADVTPEDGLVTTPVFDVHLSDAMKYTVFCDTDKLCELSFWANMIGALDPLPPLGREEVGHTQTGSCTTLPIEGQADYPGFSFNGFFEAGDGSAALVPVGGEDAYCAAGTGAIVETAVQQKVWAHIDPMPFNATERATLVFRCMSGDAGCDHRMTVYLGALTTPRYDTELGPPPTA